MAAGYGGGDAADTEIVWEEHSRGFLVPPSWDAQTVRDRGLNQPGKGPGRAAESVFEIDVNDGSALKGGGRETSKTGKGGRTGHDRSTQKSWPSKSRRRDFGGAGPGTTPHRNGVVGGGTGAGAALGGAVLVAEHALGIAGGVCLPGDTADSSEGDVTVGEVIAFLKACHVRGMAAAKEHGGKAKLPKKWIRPHDKWVLGRHMSETLLMDCAVSLANDDSLGHEARTVFLNALLDTLVVVKAKGKKMGASVAFASSLPPPQSLSVLEDDTGLPRAQPQPFDAADNVPSGGGGEGGGGNVPHQWIAEAFARRVREMGRRQHTSGDAGEEEEARLPLRELIRIALVFESKLVVVGGDSNDEDKEDEEDEEDDPDVGWGREGARGGSRGPREECAAHVIYSRDGRACVRRLVGEARELITSCAQKKEQARPLGGGGGGDGGGNDTVGLDVAGEEKRGSDGVAKPSLHHHPDEDQKTRQQAVYSKLFGAVELVEALHLQWCAETKDSDGDICGDEVSGDSGEDEERRATRAAMAADPDECAFDNSDGRLIVGGKEGGKFLSTCEVLLELLVSRGSMAMAKRLMSSQHLDTQQKLAAHLMALSNLHTNGALARGGMRGARRLAESFGATSTSTSESLLRLYGGSKEDGERVGESSGRSPPLQGGTRGAEWEPGVGGEGNGVGRRPNTATGGVGRDGGAGRVSLRARGQFNAALAALIHSNSTGGGEPQAIRVEDGTCDTPPLPMCTLSDFGLTRDCIVVVSSVASLADADREIRLILGGAGGRDGGGGGGGLVGLDAEWRPTALSQQQQQQQQKETQQAKIAVSAVTKEQGDKKERGPVNHCRPADLVQLAVSSPLSPGGVRVFLFDWLRLGHRRVAQCLFRWLFSAESRVVTTGYDYAFACGFQ